MTVEKMVMKSQQRMQGMIEKCIIEMSEVKSMRHLGERVLGEHLFYGLTNIGPIASIHAVKHASSDTYTSSGNGEYQRNHVWRSISFNS